MKKFLSFFAAAMLAVGFTSCEEVEPPYEIPGENPSEQPGEDLEVNDSLVENGDFEAWTDGLPNSWKSKSSASSAVLEQSTDAHSGSYSVLVKGSADANKRLGYKETTYKAGSYTITFYAKAATADGGSVRPGYATFNEDGSINSQGYTYGDYVNNLTNTQWTKVQHTVNLDSDQQICWVIMNSKNPGKDVLIDDFVVSTTNGGIIEGAGGEVEEPVAPSEKVTLPYQESFATSLGSFKNATTSGSGAWINDYSTAKATGYDNASKATTAGTYYLVSPEIDLTNVAEAHVAYEYILRYDVSQDNQQFLITTDVDKDAATAAWTLLNKTHTEGTDWNTFSKADLQVPAEFLGKKVRVAFRYNADASNCSTWEVKNFLIAEGKASEGNEGGEEVGGDQGGSEEGSGEESGNSITYKLSDAGLGNATDLGTLTLSDGTTLTFAQEGGNNAPKYYEKGTSARMYALNSLTITANQKIAKVILNCDTPYSGTKYNGNDQMTATPGTVSKASDTNITISDINSNSTKIVNDHTGNSGGTQIRIVSLTITYAE